MNELTANSRADAVGEGSRSIPAKLWALLLLAALASVMAQAYPSVSFTLGEGFEVPAVAKNLALEGEFANPFHVLRTGPTAHVSPIYPLFLAALFRIFGVTDVAFSLVLVGLVVMHTLYPLLLFGVGRKFFDSNAAGLTSAALSIVWPTFPLITNEYIWETNAMLICCLMTFDWRERGRIDLRRSAAAGVVSGAIGLLAATSILISIPWFAYLHFQSHRESKSFGLAAGAFLMGLFAAISPWVIRNNISLGAPILFRSNYGLELGMSHNRRAAATQAESLANGTFDALHPNFSKTEAQKVAALGEVEYNRQRLAGAVKWIRDRPNLFVAVTLKRVCYFWFPDRLEYDRYSGRVWLLTGLAFGGLLLLIRKRNHIAGFFAALLILFPIPIYLIHVTLRYRLPLIPMEVLLAGYFLSIFWARLRLSFLGRTFNLRRPN